MPQVIMISYRDQINFTLSTNPAQVPDPGFFVRCFFEELYSLAELALNGGGNTDGRENANPVDGKEVGRRTK